MEDEDKEEDIDDGIVIATSKKQKEVGSLKTPKFVAPKMKDVGREKHSSPKRKKKEVTKRPGPKVESLPSEGVSHLIEGPGTSSK